MDILLGLDLGTTSFKAAACDLNGRELAVAREATPWESDPTGTSMTADVVFGAAVKVLLGCLEQLPTARVLGLGITGMAEAGFLVDEDGTPHSPAFAWLDERGNEQLTELEAEFGAERFASTTGLPGTVRSSAVKLRWLAQNCGRSPGSAWESLPEWMARQFGGRPCSELSLAARTGLLDLTQRNWHPELARWAGLEPAALNPLATAGSSWGSASRPAQLVGATITVAGHDHVCAAVGAGALLASDVFDSLGTGEGVIRSSSLPTPDETGSLVAGGMTVGIHVLPDEHLLMAGLGTGARLSRVLTVLGVSTPAQKLALDEAASRTRASKAADWAVETVFTGRKPAPAEAVSDDPAGTWRAALEAAASRLADAVERLDRHCGPSDRLVAVGGWFASGPFVRIRREALGRPITLPAVQEATGRGAALMAGVAADLYESVLTVPAPPMKVI